MKLGEAAARLLSAFTSGGMWRALRHRDFALFSMFGWLSTIGFIVQRMGVQWLTWEMTHSFAWLGAVALAEASLGTLIMPIGGALADRFDRLQLARYSQFGAMIMSAILAVVTLGGMMNVWLLMVLIALSGAVDGIYMPTRSALMPNLVPREDMPAAIGVGSLLFNMAQFLGPAVAGLLIIWIGVGATFALNAITYTGVICVFYMINVSPEARKPKPTGDSILGGFVYAFSQCFKNPALAPLMFFGVTMSLFLRPYRELFAGWADGVFSQGEGGFALIASISGLAATFVSVIVANFVRTKGLVNLIMFVMPIQAVLLIMFALAGNFHVAIAFSAAMSACMAVVGISTHILVQNAVPDHLRGRVMSIWGLQMRGVLPFGAWVMGMVAGYISFQTTLAIAGAACLVSWVGLLSHRKAMERLERVDAPLDIPPRQVPAMSASEPEQKNP